MEIKNLSKSFGDKVIFDNAYFNIPDNKITFIMGESGCGKTTLLRILTGLDTDFIGEIPKFESLSCVFQEPRLFSSLTVEKNISIVKDKASLTVNDVLKILELENEINSFPEELSGGMKMRISLARALYYDGDVFIMDEPFSALDNATKERILPKIFNLLKNKTVIIVSHNYDEANKYADEIINLSSPLKN